VGVGAVVLLILGACAASGNESAGTAPGLPNFWLGLWHGVISPVTFLVSLFRDDVGIYAVRNSGAWYDFGFMVGVSIAFGSTARAGAGTSRRRDTSRARRDDRG
jgi:hypothetical protein